MQLFGGSARRRLGGALFSRAPASARGRTSQPTADIISQRVGRRLQQLRISPIGQDGRVGHRRTAVGGFDRRSRVRAFAPRDHDGHRGRELLQASHERRDVATAIAGIDAQVQRHEDDGELTAREVLTNTGDTALGALKDVNARDEIG